MMALPGPIDNPAAALEAEWRVGRSLGRTVYARVGDDEDGDVLIGLLDSAEIAAHIVRMHNVHRSSSRWWS